MEKNELKKELFKQIFGAMVDVKFSTLTEDEVITIAMVAVRQFSGAFSSRSELLRQALVITDRDKYRNLSWATYGMEPKLVDFKKTILSGATTAN